MANSWKVRLLPKLVERTSFSDRKLFTSWIEDFLTARQQHVVVGGETSNWLDVTLVVPQGSNFRAIIVYHIHS